VLAEPVVGVAALEPLVEPASVAVAEEGAEAVVVVEPVVLVSMDGGSCGASGGESRTSVFGSGALPGATSL
jgi:hypothetical protein